MKKAYKGLELKGKDYKKKLDDLQVSLTKHLDQYVGPSRSRTWFVEWLFCIFLTEFLIGGSRIHKDLVDPEKLQATLTNKSLTEACDLRRALEMVTLLEAQLKEMSPNLDSISE